MPATVDPMQLVLLFIIPFFLSMRLDRVMPSSAPLGQTRVTSASLVFTDLPADPCRVLQRQRHLPWLCFWPGCTAYDMVPACVCCVCDLVGQHLLVGAWLWQGNPLCILQAQASTLPAAMQHLNHRTTHCNVQPVTCTSMQSSTPLPSHCPPVLFLGSLSQSCLISDHGDACRCWSCAVHACWCGTGACLSSAWVLPAFLHT